MIRQVSGALASQAADVATCAESAEQLAGGKRESQTRRGVSLAVCSTSACRRRHGGSWAGRPSQDRTRDSEQQQDIGARYPIDLAKTRMQLDKGTAGHLSLSGAAPESSVMDIARFASQRLFVV